MNVHIAIYEWKANTRDEYVKELLTGIANIETLLPNLQIFVGENTSRYGDGYSHAIVVVGKTQADVDAYRAHPEHQCLADGIDNIEARGIGVDFVNRFV